MKTEIDTPVDAKTQTSENRSVEVSAETALDTAIAGTALARESQYFDGTVSQSGDFNPFADRGWSTLAKRFAEMVPAARPLALLDVGCGTGQSRQLYIDDCREYIGLDISAGALALAEQKFPASRWVRGDASRLQFEANRFNVVAFSSVLHHIEDFHVPLRDAYRVLRSGGYVFAFDPNLLHPAMALLRHPRSPFYSPKGVSPNERPLTPRSLSTAFRKAGFESIRQRCQADIPYRAVAPKLPNTLLGAYNLCDRVMEMSGLGRLFGTFVVTVGRKA